MKYLNQCTSCKCCAVYGAAECVRDVNNKKTIVNSTGSARAREKRGSRAPASAGTDTRDRSGMTGSGRHGGSASRSTALSDSPPHCAHRHTRAAARGTRTAFGEVAEDPKMHVQRSVPTPSRCRSVGATRRRRNSHARMRSPDPSNAGHEAGAERAGADRPARGEESAGVRHAFACVGSVRAHHQSCRV